VVGGSLNKVILLRAATGAIGHRADSVCLEPFLYVEDVPAMPTGLAPGEPQINSHGLLGHLHRLKIVLVLLWGGWGGSEVEEAERAPGHGLLACWIRAYRWLIEGKCQSNMWLSEREHTGWRNLLLKTWRRPGSGENLSRRSIGGGGGRRVTQRGTTKIAPRKDLNGGLLLRISSQV